MGSSNLLDSGTKGLIRIYMIQIGYTRCEYDCCVYVRILEDGSYIFLLLYVDNMLIVAKRMCEVNRLKSLLHRV